MPLLQLICWQGLAFLSLQKHHSDLCLHHHMIMFVVGRVVLCPELPALYKNTSRVVLGPTLMTSFELDYFCRDPICFQARSHSETIEVWTPAYLLWENTVQQFWLVKPSEFLAWGIVSHRSMREHHGKAFRQACLVVKSRRLSHVL